MFRKLVLPLAFAALQISPAANADSTVCSDPSRAKVLARGKIVLPGDNIKALEEAMSSAARKIDMRTWTVVGKEGDGTVTSHTIGLQSPEVSVSIEADWEPGWKHAKIMIERTCYDDALEPWEGYWADFLREMKQAGFEVTNAKR